jgi:hypothetical protein
MPAIAVNRNAGLVIAGVARDNILVTVAIDIDAYEGHGFVSTPRFLQTDS